MSAVQYSEGGIELLDRIQPLWERLNEQHRAHSPHFATLHARMTFTARRNTLAAKGGLLHALVVTDEDRGCDVGYCISTVTDDKVGEIESLYLDSEYRGQGIGDRLMRSAVAWLDEQGAKSKRLGVAVGNERAFSFYARFGFHPRTTILQQVRPE